MLTILIACAVLVGATILIHYEVLRALDLRLRSMATQNRRKLLVVIFATFLAHAAEVALYGLGYYVLTVYVDVGQLTSSAGFSWRTCMYFSLETYTTLSLGDITPVGEIRLLAGAEALNGLLLVGWSASFAYLTMGQFWNSGKDER